MNSQTLSVIINRPASEVNSFASDLKNLPRWATAFVKKISQKNGIWEAETPYGLHRFRIVEKNNLGVLDHWVTPPKGAEVYVPMRVIPHGEGAEVLFTLIKNPGMSAEQFKKDAEFVTQDLATLKKVLEPEKSS